MIIGCGFEAQKASKGHRYTTLASLTPPKTHGLAVLLDLGNQGVTMLHNIGILLVLVIWPIRLDDTIDTIDGARNAVV